MSLLYKKEYLQFFTVFLLLSEELHPERRKSSSKTQFLQILKIDFAVVVLAVFTTRVF